MQRPSLCVLSLLVLVGTSLFQQGCGRTDFLERAERPCTPGEESCPCTRKASCSEGLTCVFDLCEQVTTLPDLMEMGIARDMDVDMWSPDMLTSCTPASPTMCDQECVNTTTDPDHCGGCNVVCGSGQMCTGGSCLCGGQACNQGFCQSDRCVTATFIAAGKSHTCAVMSDGSVQCWGENAQGQLGDGTREPSSVPVEVKGVEGAIHVAMWDTYSCAIVSGGTIKCWGSQKGGIFPRAPRQVAAPATDVEGIQGATSLELGEDYACAVLATGSVSCWGNSSMHVAPTSQGKVQGVRKVSGGPLNLCALHQDGSVSCWGNVSQEAKKVRLVNNAKDLVTGAFWTCALEQTGEPVCWIQSKTRDPEALEMWRIPGGQGATDLSTHGDTLCMADASGTLHCNGINQPMRRSSDSFELPQGWTQRVQGGGHHCVIASQGEVLCRGLNDLGQLGSQPEYRPQYTRPRQVNIHHQTKQISTGNEHTCALNFMGEATCWGSMQHIFADQDPLPLLGSPVRIPELQGLTHIESATLHSCAIHENGEVFCWGRNLKGYAGVNRDRKEVLSPVKTPNVRQATGLALGDEHTCAIEAGKVKCWGENKSGELGSGGRYAPTFGGAVEVIGLKPVKQIAAGRHFTCALEEEGNVKCWGLNDQAQLGIPTSTRVAKQPVLLPQITQAKEIGAGWEYACALLSDGTVGCWGGRDPEGPGYKPYALIQGIQDATHIAVGGQHACALDSGRVKCWGANSFGQLGAPTDLPYRQQPLEIGGFSDVLQLSAHNHHTCARRRRHTMWCWGNNRHGEVGQSSVVENQVFLPVVWSRK